MTFDDYEEQISESLYFGPWNELNPEKALTLLKMAGLELNDSDMVRLYCSYVNDCFENSVKYGSESRDYYEKALQVFRQMVDLLDEQKNRNLFDRITEDVQKAIEFAEKATGWASGYDLALEDMWFRCKWYDDEWED